VSREWLAMSPGFMEGSNGDASGVECDW